MVEIS
jgi:hypothetical protein